MELNRGHWIAIVQVVALITILAFLVFMSGAHGENTPPEIQLVHPEDNGIVSNPLTLMWLSDDPDDDTITIDLYLDTDPDPVTLILNDTLESSYDLEPLTTNTTYFWKIIAFDGEHTNESETRNFTLVNSPPEIVLWNPDSPHRSTTYLVSLVWFAIDPDGDPLTYDVYLDTNSTPITLVTTTENIRYFPPPLAKDTTYYWMVAVFDGWERIETPTRSFTVTNTATEVEWMYSGYRTYEKSAENMESGGYGYPFRMYRNNTLDVDISVSGGKADFFLIKGNELRIWEWGGTMTH